MSVAICPHLSLEHYRGGEKWTTQLANRLADDGFDVAVRALPYAPNGKRRVAARDVLDDAVDYREAWRHDLSAFDVAYVFYNPLSRAFFDGDTYRIAGIHSWIYVSDRLYEPHYGIVPTGVKVLYRLLGDRELRGFDAVHTVTPAFDCANPDTVYVPNYVDADLFRPSAAPTAEEFTVLVTAARIPEKGWDTVRAVARRLADEPFRVVATGGEDGTGVEGVEDLGFLSERELAAWYARATVVLHPTRVDADSIVMKESLAAGTPVVTTRLPTHRTDGDTAAILFSDTPEEIVERLWRLREEWNDDTGYVDRARAARGVGERYDEATVYPRLKELLTAPTSLLAESTDKSPDPPRA